MAWELDDFERYLLTGEGSVSMHPVPVDDDQRDAWQEYKDGVAMGYINPDGTQREPDPEDYLEIREGNASDQDARVPPVRFDAEPPF